MVSKALANVMQRQIRSVGLSIKSSDLQDKLIDWTEEFCSTKHFKPKDVHVLLFNSHNASLANKFVERKFPSLCLIESNQEKANLQKDNFISNPSINAYHASIQDDLLAPPRSKVLKNKFLSRILKPHKKCQLSLLIGIFPFLSQQKLIIESMLNQYLIHARRMSPGRRWEHRLNEIDNQILPDFYPPKTIYQEADISLITFVNPFQLGRLLCAHDESMTFFSRQHIHFSLLFNICFDVLPLTHKIGYDTSNFSPDMIETGDFSYEKGLATLGYSKDYYYPVAITPKNVTDIFNYYNELSPDLDNASVLLELACWLTYTGRLTSTRLVNKQLRSFFSDYGISTDVLFPEEMRASDVTNKDILDAFPRIRSIFRQPEGRSVLETFTGKLIKTKMTDYAD